MFTPIFFINRKSHKKIRFHTEKNQSNCCTLIKIENLKEKNYETPDGKNKKKCFFV